MARLAKAILWYWGPALLMLGVIAFESTDLLSAAHTGKFVVPLLHALFPSLSPPQLAEIHGISRKVGHVIGYGLLSWLLFRAWWGTMVANTRNWQFRFALFGWVCATGVAMADEFHQMTIPSRGGSVHDIVLDSTAALAAQLILWLLLRRTRQSRSIVAAT